MWEDCVKWCCSNLKTCSRDKKAYCSTWQSNLHLSALLQGYEFGNCGNLPFLLQLLSSMPGQSGHRCLSLKSSQTSMDSWKTYHGTFQHGRIWKCLTSLLLIMLDVPGILSKPLSQNWRIQANLLMRIRRLDYRRMWRLGHRFDSLDFTWDNVIKTAVICLITIY